MITLLPSSIILLLFSWKIFVPWKGTICFPMQLLIIDTNLTQVFIQSKGQIYDLLRIMDTIINSNNLYYFIQKFPGYMRKQNGFFVVLDKNTNSLPRNENRILSIVWMTSRFKFCHQKRAWKIRWRSV